MSKGTRLLLWITGFGLVIAAVATIAVVVLLGRSGPRVEEGTWLEVELAGEIPDGPEADAIIFDPNDIPLTVEDIANGLHAAAADPAVAGIIVHLDGPALDMAATEEIQDGLMAMKKAGKPCKAWSKTYDNTSWRVASPCELHLHPEGVPLAIGLRMGTTHFAGLFEKLGVTSDFERVGTYKSAIEAYELTQPSEPTVLMYTEMIDSLNAAFIADLAEGRGIDAAAAQALIDDPPVTAQSAETRGMVDALTYGDLFKEEQIPEKTVKLREYSSDLQTAWSRADQQVAVLHLSGTIIDGESSNGGFGGGTSIGDKDTVKTLEDLAEDDDVIAVVLRVDSPGGSALASDVMWRAIRKLDEKKPVVTSMGGYAASGGYYISMATRHIVAQPSTITGSIGVFGGKLALRGLMEQVGISTWSVQRGPLAGLFSVSDPFTDLERAKIRERIEAFYTTFVTKAAEGRHKTYDEIHAVAQGRVWTGAQALEVGLVDELGGVDLAVSKAIELAAPADPAAVGRVILPRRKPLFEALSEELEQQQGQAQLLGPELATDLAQARQLESILAHGGIAAMEPVQITIH